MRARRDILKTSFVRRFPRRLLAVALILLLVVTLAPLSAATAGPDKPWLEEGTTWTGTIETTLYESSKNPSNGEVRTRSFTAKYTDLRSLGATANAHYTGRVQAVGRQTGAAWSCGSSYEYSFSFDEDAAAFDPPRSLVSLETDAYWIPEDDRRTWFVPSLYSVPYTYTSCGQVSEGRFSELGFQTGWSSWNPLPDEDPEPLHLKGTRTWTVEDPPRGMSFDPAYEPEYTFTATYDLWLKEVPVMDSCDDEGAEARYTTAEGVGSVVLAGLPDPHVATVSFGVDWCLTDAGARVDRVPSRYVIPTDNWFLLGAVETLGFEMGYPIEPKIEKRLRNVRATALIGMKINPAELVLAFAPTGRLLDEITDGLRTLVRKLRRSDTKEEATSRIAEFERSLIKKLRAWKVDFRAKINKKIRRWYPGTNKQADKIANQFGRELEQVCDLFEDGVMYLTRGQALKDIRDEGVAEAIGRVYEWAFGKYKVPIWDVDATLYFADTGTATLSDSSSGRGVFTVKSQWTTDTTP